jgi:hypothetical protein
MLQTLLTPLFILVAYACARSADLSIMAAIGRSYVRAVVYGIIGLLALVYLVLALLGR